MELIDIEFEKNLIIHIGGKQISITPFKSTLPCTVSVGIEAPKDISVNREEIFKKKQLKQ